jgi:hypothetical protein
MPEIIKSRFNLKELLEGKENQREGVNMYSKMSFLVQIKFITED